MKREQLKELGISEELINGVMKLYNESVTELKATADASLIETRKQLEEANKTMEGFKGLDIEGIKKAADDWKNKYETAEKDATEKIDRLSKTAAAKEYASGLKFSSSAAKKQFINDFLEAGMKFKDGSFLGADDFMKKYAESDPGTFVQEQKTPVTQVDFSAGHGSAAEPDKKAQLNAAFSKLVQ